MTPIRAALASQAGPRLVARGDVPVSVIIRPVGEGGRGPEAALCSPSSSFGVGLHHRHPQVGVVDIALRSVGDELAGRSRDTGCGLNEGVLIHRNQ